MSSETPSAAANPESGSKTEEAACAAEPRVGPDDLIRDGDFRKLNAIGGGIVNQRLYREYWGLRAGAVGFPVFRPSAEVQEALEDLEASEPHRRADRSAVAKAVNDAPAVMVEKIRDDGTKFSEAVVFRNEAPVVSAGNMCRCGNLAEFEGLGWMAGHYFCASCLPLTMRVGHEVARIDPIPEHEHVSGSFTVKDGKTVWAPEGGPVQEVDTKAPVKNELPCECWRMAGWRNCPRHKHLTTPPPEATSIGLRELAIGEIMGDEDRLSDGERIPSEWIGLPVMGDGVYRRVPLTEPPVKTSPALSEWFKKALREAHEKDLAQSGYKLAKCSNCGGLREAHEKDLAQSGYKLAKCSNCGGLLYLKPGEDEWFHDGAICGTGATPVNVFDPAAGVDVPPASGEISSYQMEIHRNPDARAWAEFFIGTLLEVAQRNLSDNPNPTKSEVLREIGELAQDPGYMVSWFSNAMMAMHDHLRSKVKARPSWLANIVFVVIVMLIGSALGIVATLTVVFTSR